MKLKDLYKLQNAIIDLGDFAEANTDGDESGIGDELALKHNEAIKIINKEMESIYLRNAKARLKREDK